VANLGSFDATQVPPSESREALPAGKYKCVAIESDYKDTKDNTGKYLEFCFEVVEGQYKGRRLWDRLNLVNGNALTVEIARQTLSAICHAVGVLQPKDSQQLHNIPLIVKVACKTYKGEIKNEVKGYEKVSTAVQATASKSAPVEKAPWEQ
jgi:hypothetical protein